MMITMMKVGLKTLGSINPISLESVQSYDNIVKSGFGETMTLSNDDPTILESNKNQVPLCFNVLFLYNIILHRKWVRFKFALYLFLDALYYCVLTLVLM